MDEGAIAGFIVGGLVGGLSAAVSGWVVGHFNVRAAETRGAAEAQRMERQHERADREHRQGVYHAFMNALSAVTKAATAADVEGFRAAAFDPDPEGKATQLFIVQVGQVRQLLNGILLFGTPDVAERARDFDKLFRKAEAAVQADAVLGALSLDANATAFRDLLDGWDSAARTSEWRSAVAELEKAMRRDVAGE